MATRGRMLAAALLPRVIDRQAGLGAFRIGREHYDLGNDLFEVMLTMTDPTGFVQHILLHTKLGTSKPVIITAHSSFHGRTLATITASELGIGAGDDFEFVLGDGGHEIPDEAIMASVRESYFDWTAEEPATFTIECLDPEPVELPPLDDRLHAAVDQVSDSLRYWAHYLASNRAERLDNSFASTVALPAKGLTAARYEFCFWDLDPGDADDDTFGAVVTTAFKF